MGRALRAAVVVLLVATGLVAAPLAMPVLPVEHTIAYQSFLGLAPERLEKKEYGPLPQHFADQFGWAELAASVTAVHRSLPPEEQAGAPVIVSNYGEGAALELFSAVPILLSTHNNYHLWGPRGASFDPAIAVNIDREDLEPLFTEIVTATVTPPHPYVMPYENRIPISVCRGYRGPPLVELWPTLKHCE